MTSLVKDSNPIILLAGPYWPCQEEGDSGGEGSGASGPGVGSQGIGGVGAGG